MQHLMNKPVRWSGVGTDCLFLLSINHDFEGDFGAH